MPVLAYRMIRREVMADGTSQHPILAPAARYPEMARRVVSAQGSHGRIIRGLMSTPRSDHFQGRFGRMFGHLPAATYGKTDPDSRAALMKLGSAMTAEFDGPKDGFDGEESGIPALYTYFGQFVDHDITFDPMSSLIKRRDPDSLVDFRTPALDLDNVYGRGPDDQPYMYQPDGKHFLLGDPLDNGAHDLVRNNASPRRALIGDPRNDENSIVSQLQGLMHRFHNKVVDKQGVDFATAQKIVRWHYQWIVVHDFLPKIIIAKVLHSLKTDDAFDHKKLKYYHWRNDPFMPVEFAVAAYRLGHSMIRPGYRLNGDDATLLPIFPVPSQNLPDGLTGFQAMAPNRGIDWGRFIDVGAQRPYGEEPNTQKPATEAMRNRLQFAYRIDTSLVNPLASLPSSVASDPPPSLAQRNLLRGFELGLPTGQDVAQQMRETVLTDEEIVLGKAVDGEPGKGDVFGTIKDISGFEKNCPLWTYILAEAMHNKTTLPIHAVGGPAAGVTTPQLGPVGGRIVAEVFLGMLFGDSTSFLSAAPSWRPTLAAEGNGFTLRDLVNYATT